MRRNCATRLRSSGLLDVNTDLYVTNPQMTIDIDREKAAVYGVTVDQVRQELFNAFGTRQVATIYTATNDYQIILEAQAGDPARPASLSKIYVKTTARVAIGRRRRAGQAASSPETVCRPASRSRCPRSPGSCRSVGPLQVNHQGQQPAVTISFNLAPGFCAWQSG